MFWTAVQQQLMQAPRGAVLLQHLYGKVTGLQCDAGQQQQHGAWWSWQAETVALHVFKVPSLIVHQSCCL